MRLIHALAALSLLSETPRAEGNHEGARIQRHNAEIEADLLRNDKPIRGVRKMSSDEGEKFFLDYWSYDGSDGLSMGNHTGTDNDDTHDNIQPRSYPFQPASINQARGISLSQRDFQCPAGTTGCTSINRPSSCCTTGDICELVQDTGSGDVGCCPQGQTCSGVIGSCQSGYTACPAKLGGGCCIPGYECVSGGCAYVSTVTVTVHSTVFVSTKTYTTPPSSYVPSSTSTGTSKTSSDDLVPPARPTSLSTATTSKSSSETGSICPIGFYACSAVYQGGCCRTGRDCDTTSCPTISSTAVVSNNDETIVAPAVSTGSATCASGWFGCDESMGGGCCPTGFACGSASCTASTGGSVTATGTVAKETGGGSGRSLDGRMLLIVLVCIHLRNMACLYTAHFGKSPCRDTFPDWARFGRFAGASPSVSHCPLLSSSVPSSLTSFSFFLSLIFSTPLSWYILVNCFYPYPAMSQTNTQKPLPFGYQFAAGAVAGVSEILVMYPLDVVKTRVQLQTNVAAASEEGYNGMFDCFRKIIKNEGPSRLYRGISAPILMEAPKRATKFAANDSWGSFYRNLFGAEKQTQGLATLTGATAGATEAFVVVPFELVKIRLQDRSSAGKYNGMFDVVRKIVATEGPLAMYNGLESTLWRHILWNGGYFGCIFQVRAQLPKAEAGNKAQQTRNDLIAGTVGGIMGTVLNTPMDVVKSRIQNTTKVPGQVPKYNWAWPAVATVMKEEGFGALYKGFIPKVLRLGPGGGILLVVFTGVMDFFRKMRGE